jgi:hypothetical protein
VSRASPCDQQLHETQHEPGVRDLLIRPVLQRKLVGSGFRRRRRWRGEEEERRESGDLRDLAEVVLTHAETNGVSTDERKYVRRRADLIRAVEPQQRPDRGETVLDDDASLDSSLLEDDVEQLLERALKGDDLLQVGVSNSEVVEEQQGLCTNGGGDGELPFLPLASYA